MNSRLSRVLEQAKITQRPIFMAALVAGDPYLDATLDYMRVLADEGADLIELILPFSDPTYHGAVIQRASARALREEVSWEEIVTLGQRFRETHQTPVILSTYYNRVLSRGVKPFIASLCAADFDGALVTDLPFDESEKLRAALGEANLVLPPFIAPTTSLERFEHIAQGCDSFLVWTGHTGGDPTITAQQFEQRMREFKAISSRPILGSMKVADAERAKMVSRHCDGVLVGSAMVWLIEGRGSQTTDTLAAFVRDLRAGMDAE